MRFRRLPAWLIVSLTAAIGSPGSALAQEGELQLRLSALEGPIGSRRTQDEFDRGLNLLDCESPGDSWIEFSLIAGSGPVNAVDVWVGVGNETCRSSESRTPPTATCRRLDYLEIGRSLGSAPEPGSSTIAIGLDAIPRDDFAFCSSGARSQVNFFFVADTENFMGGVESISASSWTSIPVIVDAAPPSAPTPKAASYAGNRQVTVEWNRVGSGAELILYQIYVEPDGCDPSAASGLLTPGERAPLMEDLEGTDILYWGFENENRIQGESFSISTETAGLAVGESASVYVTATDPARNESVVGEPICISRVETVGFCDAWSQAEGRDCPGSCATLGATPSSVLGLSAALSLLVLGARRRRRSDR